MILQAFLLVAQDIDLLIGVREVALQVLHLTLQQINLPE